MYPKQTLNSLQIYSFESYFLPSHITFEMDAPSSPRATPVPADSSPLSSPCASPTPCHRPRQYNRRTTERLSMEDKLQEMVSTLGRLNWSFRDFVHAWAGAEGRARDAKLNHRIYLYSRPLVDECYRKPSSRPGPWPGNWLRSLWSVSKWWEQHWVTAATAL